MQKHLFLAVLAATLTVTGPAAGLAYATAEPGWRCARALSLASQDLLRGEARHLNRCVLALLDGRGAFSADRLCAALRTPNEGIDKRERNAAERIAARCRAATAAWMPDRCRAPGASSAARIANADDLARCAVRSARCAAVASLGDLHGDLASLLGGEHAENLSFQFGGIANNTLGSCFEAAPGVTTTTLSTGSTTTTTTNPSPTTTMITTSPPTLVVTELMSNPASQSDSAGEYIEVFNAGNASVDLAGLTVHDDGSDSFNVDAPLVVAAGGYAVLGKSATAADGKADFVYGTAMTLANSADAVHLVWNGALLDRVAYDASFPLAAGASMQLDPAAHASGANDDASVWCLSEQSMNDGDLGTPGAVNRTCS